MIATTKTKPVMQTGPDRPRVLDVDRHVGARIRERRIMRGLTQHQLAELIGVSYQQAHKYERGINRIAAGRLYIVADALGVDVNYFFEGMDNDSDFEPTPQQRMLLDLARNFISLPSREHQQTICNLARALASGKNPAEFGIPSIASCGHEGENK